MAAAPAPWVQTAFLAVWLAPIAAMQRLPGCVFHCYACPLASFACPIGLLANFSAAAAVPALATAPLLLVGVLLAAGGLVGSLICGWACPFGFVQDLLGRVPVPKIKIPNSFGYFRYVVLVGVVIILPWVLARDWGRYKGAPYEQQVVSICRECPAGGLEAALPVSVVNLLPEATAKKLPTFLSKLWSGQGWTFGTRRTIIIVLFVVGSIFMFRPWCKVFCPLGGLLSVFNRVSIFHLRFERQVCYACNTCRSRCAMGVEVEKHVNIHNCIRCMECTTCGTLYPALAGFLSHEQDQTPPHHDKSQQ